MAAIIIANWIMCLGHSVVLCLPRWALSLHGNGVHARRWSGQPHQHLRRPGEMGQVLHCRGGDGPGCHPLHGLHPSGRQTGQHAAGQKWTPQVGRLWNMHENGLCGLSDMVFLKNVSKMCIFSTETWLVFKFEQASFRAASLLSCSCLEVWRETSLRSWRTLIPVSCSCADWHGPLRYSSRDSGLHLSWGAEIPGRRWLLR